MQREWSANSQSGKILKNKDDLSKPILFYQLSRLKMLQWAPPVLLRSSVYADLIDLRQITQVCSVFSGSLPPIQEMIL